MPYRILQGSVLSPMLFNTYIQLLGEIIRKFKLQCHQYVDDIQLYLSFSSNPKEVVEGEAIMSWVKTSRDVQNLGDGPETEVSLKCGS